MILQPWSKFSIRILSHVILWISFCGKISASWEEWWTYSGISGPDFWGILNPEWRLCSRGRAQSPIDLDPDQLLFHPYLKPFQLGSSKSSATLINSGHDIAVHLSESTPVNLSGGPLQYSYVISQIRIHHGDDDTRGSEHTIGRQTYPAEIQMLGFNADLYRNFSEAVDAKDSGGLVALSVMLQVGNVSHPEFRAISSQLSKVAYRDQRVSVGRIDVSRLLPNTDEYMTYVGSLTYPSCNEGVHWIVLNRALQISRQQMSLLRKPVQGDSFNPKGPLSNNFRPLQPLNNRVVYTNIDFRRRSEVSIIEVQSLKSSGRSSITQTESE